MALSLVAENRYFYNVKTYENGNHRNAYAKEFAFLFWQKGMQIVKLCFQFSERLPSEEKYGLRSQMTRASVSIPSNIAEGSSRKSEKEYAHYLDISLGSSFELETQLLICEQLKIGDLELTEKLKKEIAEFQKMMYSFRQKLNQ